MMPQYAFISHRDFLKSIYPVACDGVESLCDILRTSKKEVLTHRLRRSVGYTQKETVFTLKTEIVVRIRTILLHRIVHDMKWADRHLVFSRSS